MLASPEQSALNSMNQTSVDWPKIDSCNFRYFERVPGFVEIKLASDDGLESLKSEEAFVGSCICKLKPPSEDIV